MSPKHLSLAPRTTRLLLSSSAALCALLVLVACGPKKTAAQHSVAEEPVAKSPATVQEATRVLDLSTFPLIDGAKPPSPRHLASLNYVASGDAKTGFEFQRKTLAAQGWKELPNSSVTDQSASGTFGRSGYVVS